MKTQRRWFGTGLIVLLASVLLACQGEAPTVVIAEPVASPPPPPETVRSNPIPPGEVLLPAALGKIQDSSEGSAGRSTVFLIGENHVNLEIQRRVADLLAYLRNAYDVKVVCSEGMTGPLDLQNFGVTTARRDVAEAYMAAQRISGVEFFALAYPDARIVGVEDMEAYRAHQAALSSAPPELEAWLGDFRTFLEEVVRVLPEDQVQDIVDAMQKLEKTHDFEKFSAELRTILGPASAEGKKLAVLLAAREEAARKAEKRLRSQAHADDPLMSRRDEAMVQGTLEAATAEPVALVVGSFHLEGVARKLKAAGQPYVSILVTGAEDSDIDNQDNKTYRDWQEGKSDLLEQWLSQLKPRPALERATMPRKVEILGSLFRANEMLRAGSTPEQVRAVLRGVSEGLEIVDCYPIEGGYGIDFTLRGRTGHAYFSTQPHPALTSESWPERLEKGRVRGLHYAVFGGGSGGPPIIPRLPSGAGDGGDSFNKRLLVALDEQKRKDPQAVTLTLRREKNGALFLLIGDRPRPLSVSVEELRRLVAAYMAAREGPDLVYAAMKLSEALLVDIDRDLPANARSLFLISQEDLLKDLSLPKVAALSGAPGTSRLAALEEAFVLPWKKAQSDLGRLSRPRVAAEIGRTVFWIGEGLESEAQHASVAEAIRKLGGRVNEPVRPRDSLILLGTGQGRWSARLTDGTTVSARESALRGAETVVSLGVDLSRAPGVNALMIGEMEGSQALAFGRELAQRIKKGAGKTLEQLVRNRSQGKARGAREHARRSLAAGLTVIQKAQHQVDRRATIL